MVTVVDYCVNQENIAPPQLRELSHTSKFLAGAIRVSTHKKVLYSISYRCVGCDTDLQLLTKFYFRCHDILFLTTALWTILEMVPSHNTICV